MRRCFPARRAPRALLSLLAVLALGSFPARASFPVQAPDTLPKIEAPELPTTLKWLNSEPLTMAKLRGKVVLIDFWEYTCINCIRTLPYLRAWHQKYRDKGLVIIGVHSPEFHFAKKTENVERAVRDFDLKYPVIVDSQHLVWQTYGNRFWPAKYLIDREGLLRYYHFGEGAYDATEAKIQALLREVNPNVELPAIEKPARGSDAPGAVCYPVTPELYAGYERGGSDGTLANKEGYRPNQAVLYKDPVNWEDGLIYLHGRWRSTAEALVSTRNLPASTDYLGIRYHALEVNSVIRPEQGKPVKVWVYHDNKPVARKDKGEDIRYDSTGRSFILVDEPRMYRLIKNAEFAQRNLKLATAEPGVGIYSFTFVSCEVPKKKPS